MKRVLVYGGAGQLGRTCIQYFKTRNWWTCCVDLCENTEADLSVRITCENTSKQTDQIFSEISSVLGSDKFDSVLCVAGGWSGGNVQSNEFLESCENMWKQSVCSSVVASVLASKTLKNDGFFQLTGANAVLKGCPGMLGYGMAKAAVHHLVKSLSDPGSGLPENSTVVAILPITLDTAMNRKCMPDADFSSWTPLEFVSKLLYDWSVNLSDRPKSGSLITLKTVNGVTSLILEE